MLRYLSLTVFALSLFLVGCEKESFDITEETPDTPDPTVIETSDEEDVFFLRLPDGENVELEGAALTAGRESGTEFIVLSTSIALELTCVDGIINRNLGGTVPGFFFVLSRNTESNEFLPLSAGGLNVEGLSDQFAFVDENCAVVPSSLNISNYTDDTISGTYIAEFFVASSQSRSCEDYTSLGPVEVVFRVPVERCE